MYWNAAVTCITSSKKRLFPATEQIHIEQKLSEYDWRLIYYYYYYWVREKQSIMEYSLKDTVDKRSTAICSISPSVKTILSHRRTLHIVSQSMQRYREPLSNFINFFDSVELLLPGACRPLLKHLHLTVFSYINGWIAGLPSFAGCIELYLGELQIEKLSGFQSFVNLETLWINNNKLKVIENLDQNTRIKALYAQVRLCWKQSRSCFMMLQI